MPTDQQIVDEFFASLSHSECLRLVAFFGQQPKISSGKRPGPKVTGAVAGK